MPRSFAVLAALSLAAAASAQLTPDRQYYGVHRPIPMTVAAAGGEARIELFAPDTPPQGGPLASAAVEPGGVNIASLFPRLWADQSPRVLYAQLVVDEKRLGPPVVLVPMVNPGIPMLYSTEGQKPYFVDPASKLPSIDAKRGEIVITPDPVCYSGVRAYADKHIVFDTTLGPLEFRLRPEHAPNTVRTFMGLVEGGFYTDIIFHRVVPRLKNGDPFVIQVGDPTGTGNGGPGYAIDYEPSKLAHDFGVLSIARDNDPNTNGSQVFVCLSREGTARLDGKYTAFAEAVAGADTILAIAATPIKEERPESPPVLISARLVDAPPFGTGPGRVARPKTGTGATPR